MVLRPRPPLVAHELSPFCQVKNLGTCHRFLVFLLNIIEIESSNKKLEKDCKILFQALEVDLSVSRAFIFLSQRVLPRVVKCLSLQFHQGPMFSRQFFLSFCPGTVVSYQGQALYLALRTLALKIKGQSNVTT